MPHRPHTLAAAATAALLAATAPPAVTLAQERGRRWSLELFGGGALSLPTPLRVEQGGEPDVSFTARYETRPWRDSPYYMYRAGRWSADGRRGWELELLHHKVYLGNPPAEVQHFEITHGYNMILLGRAARRGRTIVRAGVGAVVAHPETIVRGRARGEGGGLFGAGYFVAGAAAQLAAVRRFHITDALFAAAEGKVTGAWARVPIAGGHAVAPNVAGHALLGIGVAF